MCEKQRKKITSLIILTICLIIGSTSFVFGSEQIIKNHIFIPKDKNNLKYDVPETITQDGKKYTLKDVKYQIAHKPITKNITTRDKNDIELNITETINGENVTFTADPTSINWIEKTEDAVTVTKEYKNRNNIPNSISSTKSNEGSSINIILERSKVDTITRNERFSVPAKFYSPTADGNRFVFNGKEVTISSNSPLWNGYKEDVKKYLNLNGNTYNITGGTWVSDISKQGDSYVRTANFIGTKTVPLYRATFIETNDTCTIFTADVTYSCDKAIATAYYEKSGLGVKEIVAIGAGLLVIIIAGLLILFLIRKKRKEEI